MTSHIMAIHGNVTTGLPPIHGGADNYYLDPTQLPGVPPNKILVWGGLVKACPTWYFADSTATCPVDGNPSNPVAVGNTIDLRSIQITPGATSGYLYFNQWDGRYSGRDRQLGFYINSAGPIINLDFGIMGVPLGDMPFIELTTTAEAIITYDVVQGRFP